MADEIFKAKLQQIADNDTQIGTNDREIKGQVNALRQYGMGVTGIQRDRLGDVVYDLADGYGKGGGGAYEFDFDCTVAGQVDLADKLRAGAIPNFDLAKTYIVYFEPVAPVDYVSPGGQIIKKAVMTVQNASQARVQGSLLRGAETSNFYNVFGAANWLNMVDDSGNIYLYSYLGTNTRLTIGKYHFIVLEV